MFAWSVRSAFDLAVISKLSLLVLEEISEFRLVVNVESLANLDDVSLSIFA